VISDNIPTKLVCLLPTVRENYGIWGFVETLHILKKKEYADREGFAPCPPQ
jgi:hypothetical protein